MPNAKAFAPQDGQLLRQPACQVYMTHYIDPYITHMDQKPAIIILQVKKVNTLYQKWFVWIQI